MKLERFELERWMTRWELEVDYDICESGILPLSLGELYGLIGGDAAATLERQITTMPQSYSEARGTIALRTALADTYKGTTPDDILVTTGAIEANFLVFNTLLSPGDHVVAVSPAYQQLHSVPRAIGAEVDLWDVDRRRRVRLRCRPPGAVAPPRYAVDRDQHPPQPHRRDSR